MGRQIQFHMLPNDMAVFLDAINTRAVVTVVLRDDDTAVPEAVGDPTSETRVMVLWNRELLPTLTRKRIERERGGDYFRVPYSSPVLELSPSRRIAWNSRSALMQGRIYGFDFEQNPHSYARWFASIAGWLRRNFTRGPSAVGGYIGPSALAWSRGKGVLLPMIAPAATSRLARGLSHSS
jgi:hypothetical protein